MKPLGLSDEALKVERLLHEQIQKAVVELLETRQLYQSVEVDINPVEEMISSLRDTRRTMHAAAIISGAPRINRSQMDELIRKPYRDALDRFLTSEWVFDTEYYQKRSVSHNNGDGPVFFRTPTIKVPCAFCDAILPAHNSGYPRLNDGVTSVPLGYGQLGTMQAFTFSFLCQSCKKHPVVYLVSRRGIKLTFTGRSEFPEIVVPKFIPETEKEYFSKALISHAAGHTLAGILYLRVFIEQYMRRVIGVGRKKKFSGEELGEGYKALLNDDFPKGFITLSKIYEDLSIRIHLADASTEQFKKTQHDIELHFRQLELLPLKSATPKEQ